MAYDKVVDSAKLDADLLAVAEAIRVKAEIPDALLFPEEYIDAIMAIGEEEVYTGDATLLHIRIEAEGRMTVPLCFRQSVENGVTINWGDGSAAETMSGKGTTDILPKHTYSQPGYYKISLLPADGCTLTLGSGFSTYSIMGKRSNETYVYLNMLKKVNIGNKGVTDIAQYAFQFCYSLTSITIPEGVKSIGYNSFYYCYSLTKIRIPSSVTSIGGSAFYRCYSLKNVTIPDSVTIIGSNAFNNCYSLSDVSLPNGAEGISSSAFFACQALKKIIIPASVTSIGSYAFRECYSLASVTILGNITSIETHAFFACQSLADIKIPGSVTSIGGYAFQNCNGMKTYDFSDHTAVPTLSDTNAFNGIPEDCQILVSATLYDEWIAAANWSNYADYIVAV